MKTLYLLRHANAVPRELSLSDFDRPLDEQGQREAGQVANYLREKKIMFDFAMCSAALRTQETLESLRPLINSGSIEISIDFYNIPEDHILKHLKHVPEEKNNVLYIGHNPGVAFTILRLAKALPEVLIEGVTPATLVGFHCSVDKWKNLKWGEGEIIDIFQPHLSAKEAPAPRES